MYCANCHQRVYYKDLNDNGWCEHCQRIVRRLEVRDVVLVIAAAFVALWAVQPGF